MPGGGVAAVEIKSLALFAARCLPRALCNPSEEKQGPGGWWGGNRSKLPPPPGSKDQPCGCWLGGHRPLLCSRGWGHCPVSPQGLGGELSPLAPCEHPSVRSPHLSALQIARRGGPRGQHPAASSQGGGTQRDGTSAALRGQQWGRHRHGMGAMGCYGVGWHGHGTGSSPPPKKPLPPLGSLFFLLVPGGRCQRRSGQGKAKRALG